MKPVAEWDEPYILSLPVGEFDWLETKGRRALDMTIPSVSESVVLETISKEVSAFANSGGGMLVYGLTDPKPGDMEWHIDDGGVSVSVKKNGTKEWLETVIPAQMEPALEKFNVYAIPRRGPASNIAEERALFVIEVPDSHKAPHQAKDYKYYSRVASRAQPIRHRAVIDIMSRRQQPRIELDFELQLRSRLRTKVFSLDMLHLAVTAVNAGYVYAQHVRITVEVPESLLAKNERRGTGVRHIWFPSERGGRRYHKYILVNTRQDVMSFSPDHARTPIYGPARVEPILPTATQTWRIALRRDILPHEVVETSVYWSVVSDNCTPDTGELPIRDIVSVDRR